MDNIAEGSKEMEIQNSNSLSIAEGSAGETRSQLYRVLGYNYISKINFEILK
jgi:four helix bundle protein